MDKNTLLALVATNLPDNIAEEITPAKVREVLQQMINSDANLDELTGQVVTGLLIAAVLKLDPIAPSPPYDRGLIFYDESKNALSYYNDESDTIVNCGQEVLIKIFNSGAVTLENGFIVTSDNGSVSGVPTVKCSFADTVDNARVGGVCTHDIPIGQTGYVTVVGTISGLDTSLFSEGARLYVSDVTPGGFTEDPPSIVSEAAICLVSDALNGVVLVSPREVLDPFAVGQASTITTGAAIPLTTTPIPVEGYDSPAFVKNMIFSTPAGTNGQNRAFASPLSTPFSGFYEIAFQMSLTSSANAIVFSEVYVDGLATGLFSKFDFTTNNTAEASIIIPRTISQQSIDPTIDVEIYMYSNIATNVTINTLLFNSSRLGQP